MRTDVFSMNGFSMTTQAGYSALAIALALAAGPGLAQDRQGCALIDSALPDGCAHANAGTVVARPAPANADHEAAGDLGDLGFSISIDAAPAGAPEAPRRTVAGDAAGPDRLRAMGLRHTDNETLRQRWRAETAGMLSALKLA